MSNRLLFSVGKIIRAPLPVLTERGWALLKAAFFGTDWAPPSDDVRRMLSISRRRKHELRALRDDPAPALQQASTNPADPESGLPDAGELRSKDREE